MAPIGPHILHILKCLVPSWCNHLGRIRRCDFIGGGMSLEGVFKISKAHEIPSYHLGSSLPPNLSISVSSQLMLQLPACCYAPHMMVTDTPSEPVSPQ